MDYSAANVSLWNVVIQLGLIAGAILLANFMRQKLTFVRKSLMPVAVLGGFLLLLAKYLGLVKLDANLMEILVYHGIALGFIAMSLRVPPEKNGESGDLTGLKSGAVIVSTYLIQGVAGLIITLLLAYTFMPGMFKAAGLLLPMGYGQGPGQANNIGSGYEALGFAGGRSFGLSIAAAGYLVACVVGVLILNVLARKGKVGTAERRTESRLTVDFFQSENEIPVSDSIDKLSVQLAMVLLVYLATYLATRGLTSGIAALSSGLAATVNTLLWGFNFIIGSALAILFRILLEKGKKIKRITRQYQNNYLLNRISGFFFDIMIVAGIASINLEDIRGLWVPFLLLAAAGGVVTWFHLRFVCKKVYPDYYYEGLISMYGMLTGTISSGVLLLREIDPDLSTPAANNLITGSSFGIILGAPVLILVGLAPKSDLLCWVTLALAAFYMLVLDLLIFRLHKNRTHQ
ncbi:MAG: sodium:glutamate symporter [Oscillospiraceae bacterium]|nr:sodium:glutamate symporter [Oscillospiraceae bacterium]